MPPFLKNIAHDLVEKRLWPVAVALLAAVIAVPMMLGGSDVSAPPPAVAAAAANDSAKAGQAAVSLDTTLPAGEHARAGKVRDPFQAARMAAAAKKAAKAGATTTTQNSGGSGGTGTGATGDTPAGGGGGSTVPGTTPATPANPSGGTKPDSLDTYRLTLRFGTASNLRTLRDLARLSPLPSENNPFFVYLGVLKDGKTAVFMISSDVTATGDGKCRPSATNCQTIEVKEGDTEFFDMKSNGSPVQYEMDILHLDPTSDASKQVTAASAARAATRHSKAGATLLRTAHADGKKGFAGAGAYRWMPDTGLLIRTPSKAHASQSGRPSGSGAALPGLPVWHAELAG